MKVALVSLSHVPGDLDPDAHLARDEVRRELALALAARGHVVRVFQEHPAAAERVLPVPGAPDEGPEEERTVRWHFVPPDRRTRLARAALGAAGRDPRVLAPATALLPLVEGWKPDVIHGFDLVFYPTVRLLAAAAGRIGAPLVETFHGGSPARSRLLRPVERAALAGVSRLLYTDLPRARQWVEAGAVALDRIALVPEVSSSLPFPGPAQREAARGRLGWKGDPACLAVARLAPEKDPLTLVRALAALRRARPGAVLHLLPGGSPGADVLLPEVRATAARLGVADALVVHGPFSPAGMADAYAAADVYLGASTREVCGRAVVEALASGLPLALADIPPWRVLAGPLVERRPAPAAFFPVGDSAALAAAVAALPGGPDAREAVRAHFDATLAWPVLAARVEAVYGEALAERRGAR